MRSAHGTHARRAGLAIDRATLAHAVFALVTLMLSSALVLLPYASAHAAPMAAMGGYDIGDLMTSAEENLDLANLDAVVLLDELAIVLEKDGSMSTTTHTIVWFSTELGLDTYADLRVPYNTNTSTLEVHALRTWRDGTWWPHESELSPTAIVETTPYAVQSADDYSSMREIMLLHDGVELPCVVETAYTVTEHRDPTLGSDGMWNIPGADPAVLKVLSVSVPAGTPFSATKAERAPEPTISRSEQHGVTYEWTAELVDRLPRPLTADPTAYEPYVVWSTWDSWAAMSEAMSSALDDAAALTQALRDSVAVVTRGIAAASARAEAVAAYLRETTRGVGYDDSFWRFAPRTAARTWETAYGHRLDRAALATALLREAGITASPVFMTGGRTEVDGSVPAFSWFGGLELELGSSGSVLDPGSCSIRYGTADYVGRTVWKTGAGPAVLTFPGVESAYTLAVSLEPDEEGWSGTAMLECTGALSVHPDASGLSGETGSFSDGLAGSVLGASSDDLGMTRFDPDHVTASFALKLDAPEPDDAGRTHLVIRDPAGGVMARLPHDVHVYVEDRNSPVLLPDAMSQTVTLTLDPGEAEIIRLPEPVAVANKVGEFVLSVDQWSDGSVTVSRALSIGEGLRGENGYHGVAIGPGEWPLLRALLLEESDPRNRTIMLK